MTPPVSPPVTSDEGKRLTLLFYLPGLVDGGAERVVADLASGFAQAGHRVILAVDFPAGEACPELDPHVELVVLASGHGVSIRRLARLLRDRRPDIALAAIASANFKLVAALLLARSRNWLKRSATRVRTRLVLSYHGFDEYRTGWMSWLGYVTLPVISRIAASVVAVSDGLKNDLRVRWHAAAGHLVRIYNPVSVPPPPAGYEPGDLAARAPLVLSVGRLMPGKRFDQLIEAVSRLDDPAVRLIILGEGPERPRLEAQVEKLGLADRVELPGYTRDTGAYYARARCFALVSEKESFGLVLVEALAYGLPVIASDCGGPREVLDNGRYGALLADEAEVGLIEPLTAALHRLLKDPGDPRPRVERATCFSRATGLAAYENLFRGILAAHP